MGGARCRRDPGEHPGCGRRGTGRGRPDRRRPGGCGHHEPAGDRSRVGPGHRRAGPPRHRLAGHPDRRDRRPAGRRCRSGPVPGHNRPSAGYLLHRAQGLVAAGGGGGPAGTGRGRCSVCGHHRLLAALEPDRWRRRRQACQRRHQRLTDPPDGPGHARLGAGTGCRDGHSGVDAARDRSLHRSAGYRHRSAGRRAHLRHPRRPAGRPLRTGLPCSGRGKEHLRHRLLPAHEHRHRHRAVDQRPPDHRGRPGGRTASHLCPGGLGGHGRSDRAVATRRPRADRRIRRDRGTGLLGGRQRRRLPGAGLLWAVRPTLAIRCTRRRGRPHPLHRARASGPGGVGVNRLPDGRSARRHAGRQRGCDSRAEGRWGHGGQRPADAVPG